MNNLVGVLTPLQINRPCFDDLLSLGVNVCQLASWVPAHWTKQTAETVRQEASAKNVRITALWAGWTGPGYWNFYEGPATLGLVPAVFRDRRMGEMLQAADFAHQLGLPAIATHLGFIPEAPTDPVFQDVVIAVRVIAQRLLHYKMEFWFETGQETPITLLRLIHEVGTPNLGINLDPANLIAYGKGNPIDALDVFGKYVRNIHAKDSNYPTDPMKLGEEVKVGTGSVRFPEFARRLKEIGFAGEFIIEREISGEQQRRDIIDTITYLQNLLKNT